jgi:ABC-type multidrug transport system fused ATPase/permease subunit
VTADSAVLGEGFRFLRGHLASRHRALRRLACYSVLEALPAFLSGLLVATAIDHGFLRGRLLVGFGWLGLLAAVWVVGALATRQAYPWLADTVEPLRDSLVSALVAASLRSALRDDDAERGAAVAQATVQVETVRALFSSLLRTLRQLLTSGLAAIGGLAVLSPLLALLVVPFVTLAVILFVVLLRVLIVRNRAEVLAEEQVTARAAPVVTGVRDVITAAAEERASREVGEAIDAEAVAARALARARTWRLLVVTLGAHLPLLALLAAAPWLLAEGRLTVGELTGGVMYVFTGLEPAIQLLVNAAGTVLVSLGVVLARLAEVCREPSDPSGPVKKLRPRGHGLVLEHVMFRYSPHSAPVIHDLSLDIPEGEHLAVVGPSGVGKTTLGNLITGLSRPQHGSVRLGGSPLEEIDEAHLRRTVALIPQEAYVFAGSVRDNLTYLRPGADDRAIEEAVAAVGLSETLARLGGLDAELDPGSGALTPGTRQLIALARVYLSPARVVVLDEATCHLDPVAEAYAEQAFAQRGNTLIVIAHRISSALRAGRILVMDGADTVVGRHEGLLSRSRLYAELVGYWTDAPGALGRSGAGPARRTVAGWRRETATDTSAPVAAPCTAIDRTEPGAACRNRTDDLLITSEMLYRLS